VQQVHPRVGDNLDEVGAEDIEEKRPCKRLPRWFPRTRSWITPRKGSTQV